MVISQIKSNQISSARNQGRSTGWSQTKANPDFPRLSVHLNSVSRASSISCPSDALISQHNLTSLLRYITNSGIITTVHMYSVLIGQLYLSISTNHRSTEYEVPGPNISLDNNHVPVLVTSHCRKKLHT